jgi:hypothetical protein
MMSCMHACSSKSCLHARMRTCPLIYITTSKMLWQDGGSLLDDNGMPKKKAAGPQQGSRPWKGGNGLYCVGLGMAGLAGISRDAVSVAADIKAAVDSMVGPPAFWF